jgi:hypothetical protein
MSAAKKMMIDMIENMHDDKIFKIMSYARFVEKEDDAELILTEEEEDELIDILENSESIDGNIVLDSILGKNR